MTTVKFDLPDTTKDALVEAMCKTYNYQAKVKDPNDATKEIDNPIDPDRFTANQVIRFCSEIIQAYNINKQAELARKATEVVIKKTLEDNPAVVTIE